MCYYRKTNFNTHAHIHIVKKICVELRKITASGRFYNYCSFVINIICSTDLDFKANFDNMQNKDQMTEIVLWRNA